MKLTKISSGSSGNSIIYDNIMLDCGVPYSKIKKHLKDIKFIFISHLHKDHCMPSTIKKINYEYPRIKIIVGENNVKSLVNFGIRMGSIFALSSNKTYIVGEYCMTLEELTHDVPNYSIKIHNTKTGEKGIYIVDTGNVDNIEAKDYDYALIEANYESDEELDKQIALSEEKEEFTHLKRVKHTHLSQLQAYNWLQENNIKDYLFIHEHKEKGEKNENY